MAAKLTRIRNDVRDIGMSHDPSTPGAPKTYKQALNWFRQKAMGRFTSCDAEIRVINPRKGKMPKNVPLNIVGTIFVFNFEIAKDFTIDMPVLLSQSAFVTGPFVIFANEVQLSSPSGTLAPMRSFDWIFGTPNAAGMDFHIMAEANFTTAERTELTPASLHDLQTVHDAFVIAGFVFPLTKDVVKMLVEG